MSTRSLFTLSALVLGIGAVLSAAALIVFVTRTRAIRQQITESLEVSAVAYQIETALLSHQRDNYFYKITRNEKYLERRTQAREKLKKILSKLGQVENNRANSNLVSVTATVEEYFLEFENLRYARGTPYVIYSELSEPAARVRKEIRDLLEYNQDRLEGYRRELLNAETTAVRVGYGFALFLPTALLMLLALWRSQIVSPLEKVAKAIENFRTGKKLSVEQNAGVSEIKRVAHAFRELVSLLDSDRMDRERFLKGVAHDLKNPLAAIQMATDILLTDSETLDAGKTETIQLIRRQTAALSRLTGDIGMATNIGLDDIKIEPQNCDVRSLVSDVAAIYEHVSPVHNFELKLPDVPALCYLDSDRLNQALHNLISNAMKYSPQGGKVGICVDLDVDQVRIEVSDHGLGIKENDLERIFEPFQRAGKENSSIKGLGIGLATTKKIVERMRGRIEVQSEAGAGSTFYLIFPKSAPGNLARSAFGGKTDRDFTSTFRRLDL